MNPYQVVTDRIISLIEKEGTLPWARPWSVVSPINLASGKQYRGINRLSLSISNFSEPFFLTFKQALDMGGNVKRGEKGIPVIFWKFQDQEDNEEPSRFTAPLVRTYTVFNVSQCKSLNIAATEPIERTQSRAIKAADSLFARMKEQPRIITGGDVACYIPSQDVIHLPRESNFRSPEDFWSVKFHECLHWTGHCSRLNRDGVAKFDRSDENKYGVEELVAQLGSQFICSSLGIDSTMESSAAYVQNWLSVLRNDRTLLFKSARLAQLATDYICSGQSADLALAA